MEEQKILMLQIKISKLEELIKIEENPFKKAILYSTLNKLKKELINYD